MGFLTQALKTLQQNQTMLRGKNLFSKLSNSEFKKNHQKLILIYLNKALQFSNKDREKDDL